MWTRGFLAFTKHQPYKWRVSCLACQHAVLYPRYSHSVHIAMPVLLWRTTSWSCVIPVTASTTSLSIIINPNASDNSGARALHRPGWWQGSRRRDSNGARIGRLTVGHILSQSQMGLGMSQGGKCLKFIFPLYQLYECARFKWLASRISNVMFC